MKLPRIPKRPPTVATGLVFLAIAVAAAIGLLPSAKISQSPVLYFCIVGALFVGIPAVLGIDTLIQAFKHRRKDSSSPQKI
jgi:hypothetical protein